MWFVRLLLKGKATEYERSVFRALSALVGDERDVELAIERHFEVRPRPNSEAELSLPLNSSVAKAN
jgi:hypothetical protein